MDKRSAVISALFEKKNKRKPKNSQELQDFIKSQGGDEFLKKVDEYIEQAEKEQTKQAQKAEHGTKLQYLKSLKNKCNEDEELVYYKKGGSVKCGCKKKEEGGEINKTKSGNPIERFKAKKASLGDILTRIADATGSQDGFKKAKKDAEKLKKEAFENKWKKRQIIIGRDLERGQKDAGPEAKVQDSAVPKEDIPSYDKKKVLTKQKGSKLQKKDGKVCPKCDKIHAAGMGCSVVNKPKKYQLGGDLKVKLINEQWARRNNLPENFFSLTPEERNIALKKWEKWKEQMANNKAINDSIQKQRINYQNGIVPTNLEKEPTQIESNSNFFKKHRQGGSLNGIPFIRKVNS